MEPDERARVMAELAGEFGEAVDMTPAPDQPLHVLLKLRLPKPWQPAVTRALVRFTNWPSERPEFFVDLGVVGAGGEPPRSHSEQLVLGETWRQFSFAFTWPQEPLSAVGAVKTWLTRFAKETT